MLMLLVGGFWLLAYVNARLIERDMTELLSEQQFSAVSYIARDVDDAVRFRMQILKARAAQLPLSLLNDADSAGEFLANSYAVNILFKGGVTLVLRDRRIVADFPRHSGRAVRNFERAPYFLEAISSGEVTIGPPMLNEISQKAGVSFAAPIKNASNDVEAVLVGFATFSDTSLFGHVEDTRFGRTGYILIDVPRYGLVATSSEPSYILTPLAKYGVDRMLDRFIDGYEGTGISITAKGEEVLTSGRQIQAAGWIAQLILPTEEAFAPIRALQQRSYLIAAGFSLLTLLLAWRLLRNALRPLEEATQAIQAMVAGETELHRLPVQRNDEIGSLLASFNRLVLERQRIEGDLRQSKEIFQAIGHSIAESIFLLSPDGVVLAANPTAAQRLGRYPDELLNQDFFALFPADLGQARRAVVEEVCRLLEIRTVEDSRGDQVFALTYYPVISDEGECTAVVLVATDISERKKIEQTLEQLALSDPLTGLANRRGFMAQAERELSRMARYGGPLSLLMLDADHFKSINDRYGHQTGDEVLQRVGRLCRETLRDVDVVGRIGGEEFAVLLPRIAGEQAIDVAERLRRQIAESPLPLASGEVLQISVSIGVTSLVASVSSIDVLLHQADMALYQAKNSGRNRVCVFQPQ